MDVSALMQRAYDLINAGDIDGFVDLLAEDFVEYEVTPGIPPTKEGVRQFFTMYKAAFPDLRFTTDDILPSGDKGVARVTITGTNNGADFMGMPPTGKRVSVQAIDIIGWGADGLANAHWGVVDVMGMMQQLGVIPMPG
jgi:steroid delta-isomerase-like uncharacterized protein